MRKVPQWEFDFYALSLPRGHAFGDQPPVGAWASDDGLGCAVITKCVNDGGFGVIVMRRRVDSVWTVTAQINELRSIEDAYEVAENYLNEGQMPEPLPPGMIHRASLFELGDRKPSDVFRLLSSSARQPAAWALNQLYLAIPRPDRNWVSDCQTINFHTRLWEAQLVASFREQGLLVEQPYASPDFRIENRSGGEACPSSNDLRQGAS